MTAKIRVEVLTHHMKQSMCYKSMPASFASLEVNEAICLLQLKTVEGNVLKTNCFLSLCLEVKSTVANFS